MTTTDHDNTSEAYKAYLTLLKLRAGALLILALASTWIIVAGNPLLAAAIIGVWASGWVFGVLGATARWVETMEDEDV